MVRSNTSPSPGVGGAYSSTRKSDALGSPTGRGTGTTRFAAWDILFSSIFFFCHCERSEAIHLRSGCGSGLLSCARNGGFRFLVARLGLSREFRQRRVKSSSGTRQILEGEPAVGRLFLRFGR